MGRTYLRPLQGSENFATEQEIGLDKTIDLTYSGLYIVQVKEWTDSSKTILSAKYDITYSGLNTSQITTTFYKDDGATILRTITEDLTYSGLNLAGIVNS